MDNAQRKTRPAGRVLAFAVGLLVSACGHGTMRGSVVMKISDTEAHVCMGRGEVRAGDPVVLVRHACWLLATTGALQYGVPSETCRRQVAARGQVVRVLGDHYSVVRFPKGTRMAEGNTVEKGTR